MEIRNGNNAAACGLLREAIQHDPANGRAWLLFGLATSYGAPGTAARQTLDHVETCLAKAARAGEAQATLDLSQENARVAVARAVRDATRAMNSDARAAFRAANGRPSKAILQLIERDIVAAAVMMTAIIERPPADRRLLAEVAGCFVAFGLAYPRLNHDGRTTLDRAKRLTNRRLLKSSTVGGATVQRSALEKIWRLLFLACLVVGLTFVALFILGLIVSGLSP